MTSFTASDPVQTHLPPVRRSEADIALPTRVSPMCNSTMPKAQHTTNYRNTFIRVSDDCPVETGVIPPSRGGKQTVAGLQYAMIFNEPYAYTSDDVIFAVSAVGRALAPTASKKQRQKARDAFFSQGQACMRASPLGKQFGWGVHADAEGRIAIYPVESQRYRQLASDPKIKQLKAMRSKRA